MFNTQFEGGSEGFKELVKTLGVPVVAQCGAVWDITLDGMPDGPVCPECATIYNEARDEIEDEEVCEVCQSEIDEREYELSDNYERARKIALEAGAREVECHDARMRAEEAFNKTGHHNDSTRLGNAEENERVTKVTHKNARIAFHAAGLALDSEINSNKLQSFKEALVVTQAASVQAKNEQELLEQLDASVEESEALVAESEEQLLEAKAAANNQVQNVAASNRAFNDARTNLGKAFKELCA